jgi:ribose transport system permease protein
MLVDGGLCRKYAEMSLAGKAATSGERVSLGEAWTAWRHKWAPTQIVGEILTKRWIDNLAPMVGLVVVIAVFGSLIPEFFARTEIANSTRQLGEFSFVVMAMMIVMLAGGIDLSVGSNFALANIAALAAFNWLAWPLWLVAPAVVALSSLVGFINGVLIGYLRLRAFITTLVMMIVVRAAVESATLNLGPQISSADVESPAWTFVAEGDIAGLPFSFALLLIFAIAIHVVLTRSRPGWRLAAVGGSRRAAYNAGLPVRRIVASTYVASGALVGVGGVLYAARLGNGGNQVGVGLEALALTAALLGGNTLGGGRGSVFKANVGAVIVLTVSNGLVRLSVPLGLPAIVMGGMLLLAVAIDIKWLKNRHKLLADVYVSPGYNFLPPAPSCAPDSGSPYALNDRLRGVEIIGKGEIESPEDVILDRDDNLYSGTRHGDIVRFFAPDHKRWEVYAHIGGHPLGLAFDRADNLLVCDGGMGLYMVTPDREVRVVTDETNRSRWSVADDSRLRLADDLDIAADGRIFFSEATTRYEMHEWAVDGHESRPNGRIICYDPRSGSTRTILPKLMFPNGICMTHDGQSFLFAETYACRVSRYWFDGPKTGAVERVVDNLPGFPDNINRASDGNFWLALVGMRSPAHDLALRMPGFRKRMSRDIAPDEWMAPNINTGCVVKFNLAGEVLDSLWELRGENHPMITSMREHRGYLYLGGISNNRIGKYRIPGADPCWTGQDSYWGPRA